MQKWFYNKKIINIVVNYKKLCYKSYKMMPVIQMLLLLRQELAKIICKHGFITKNYEYSCDL